MSFCRGLNFVFICRERFPPVRVDNVVLFGEELVRRGHRFILLAQSRNTCRRAYKTLWHGCLALVGATDLGNSGFCKARRHVLNVLHDLKVFSVIGKNRCHFVQVRDKIVSGLWGLVASRVYGTKFVYWLSYPFAESSSQERTGATGKYRFLYTLRGWGLHILMYHVVLPRADHIFVQSEQMKSDVGELGIMKEKMTVVPMGVALEKVPYRGDCGNDGLEKNGKRILYLGTLIRVRRMDFLIRVLARVLKEEASAVLYMVGGAGRENEIDFLRNEAKRLGVSDSVVFTGHLPMQKAWGYVRQANVCVSPFYPDPILNSTSPTKLVEYMSMGKPVVANDHPEQRRVIEKSGAGLCVSYDEEEFAKAIIKLLRLPKEQLNRIGIKGRQFVEEYRSYKVIADMVENEYLRICGAARMDDCPS